MTWVKGQSGNPRGRVKHSIREAIRKAAGKKQPDGSTNAEAVARLAWRVANTGDLDAIKWVTDQVDGKLPNEDTVTLEAGDSLAIALRAVLGR